MRPSWQGDDLRNDVTPRSNQGLVLRAESPTLTTSTKAMSDGSYEFDESPVGKYKIVPELPKGLDFSHEYEDNYQADLHSRQGANINFLLEPATRNRGHLTLPPGMRSKTIEVVAIAVQLTKLNQFSGKRDFTDDESDLRTIGRYAPSGRCS
jgi:hypothetical protein